MKHDVHLIWNRSYFPRVTSCPLTGTLFGRMPESSPDPGTSDPDTELESSLGEYWEKSPLNLFIVCLVSSDFAYMHEFQAWSLKRQPRILFRRVTFSLSLSLSLSLSSWQPENENRYHRLLLEWNPVSSFSQGMNFKRGDDFMSECIESYIGRQVAAVGNRSLGDRRDNFRLYRIWIKMHEEQMEDVVFGKWWLNWCIISCRWHAFKMCTLNASDVTKESLYWEVQGMACCVLHDRWKRHFHPPIMKGKKAPGAGGRMRQLVGIQAGTGN